jgi:excisionase family DNA binding protein
MPPATAITPEVPLLLKLPQVAALVGLAPRTLWRLIGSNQFPAAAVSIGGRIRRWKREDIEAWVSEQSGRSE